MGVVVTPSQAAAAIRRREAESKARAAIRATRLRELQPDAHRLLTSRYGVTKVILFGSLARGEAHEHSDVDLAVAGLPLTRYFAAMADLNELFGTPVDLLELEVAGPSLQARLQAEGIEVAGPQ